MSVSKRLSIGTLFELKGLPTAATVNVFSDDTNPFIPPASPTYIFIKDMVRDVIAFPRAPGSANY